MEVDKFPFLIHDLEARLRKYNDIPNYFQVSDAPLLIDNDGGLAAAEVSAIEEHPVEVSATDEHSVQVPPSQDDHVEGVGC